MGVISTPPKPTRASSRRLDVSPAESTALPIHHHRVHGFWSRPIAGHASGSGDCAESVVVRHAATTAVINRGGRRTLRLNHSGHGGHGGHPTTCRCSPLCPPCPLWLKLVHSPSSAPRPLRL